MMDKQAAKAATKAALLLPGFILALVGLGFLANLIEDAWGAWVSLTLLFLGAVAGLWLLIYYEEKNWR